MERLVKSFLVAGLVFVMAIGYQDFMYKLVGSKVVMLIITNAVTLATFVLLRISDKDW